MSARAAAFVTSQSRGEGGLAGILAILAGRVAAEEREAARQKKRKELLLIRARHKVEAAKKKVTAAGGAGGAAVAVAAVAAALKAVEGTTTSAAKAAEEPAFEFVPNNNSPAVNERFVRMNVNALRRYKSKRASKGGKRAATRRR